MRTSYYAVTPPTTPGAVSISRSTPRYTSYYAVTPPTTPGAVSISRSTPRYTSYKTYRALAPGAAWFRTAPVKEYIPLYMGILAALNPQQVWDDLHALTGGVEPILLCFEKPPEFCHRNLAASWLSTALDVVIPEGKIDKTTGLWVDLTPATPAAPDSNQLSLL